MRAFLSAGCTAKGKEGEKEKLLRETVVTFAAWDVRSVKQSSKNWSGREGETRERKGEEEGRERRKREGKGGEGRKEREAGKEGREERKERELRIELI